MRRGRVNIPASTIPAVLLTSSTPCLLSSTQHATIVANGAIATERAWDISARAFAVTELTFVRSKILCGS